MLNIKSTPVTGGVEAQALVLLECDLRHITADTLLQIGPLDAPELINTGRTRQSQWVNGKRVVRTVQHQTTHPRGQ